MPDSETNMSNTAIQATHSSAEAIWSHAASVVDNGGSLPAQCYTDPSYLRFEIDTIFARTWAFAGIGSQIPDQGDAIASKVGDQNIILVRDEGRVRALRNICPHRGVCLLEGSKKGAKSFTCPYHSWSFGLKGELRTRPHFFGGGKHDVNKGGSNSDVRLEELRVGQWADFIFVNLSGTAEPLEEYLAPFIEKFRGYDFSKMTFAGSYDLDAPGNWKLVAENYLDNYHIFAAHKTIDASYPQHMRTMARAEGKTLIYNGFQMDRTRKSYMGEMPINPDVGSAMDNMNNFLQVFPNVLLHIWPFTVMAMQLIPVTTNKTIERYFFWFYAPNGLDDDFKEQRETAMNAYRDINQNEDFPLFKAMQAARENAEFDQGVLSPFWDLMITDYAKQYIDVVRSVTNR